jgi:hypothetical protein
MIRVKTVNFLANDYLTESGNGFIYKAPNPFYPVQTVEAVDGLGGYFESSPIYQTASYFYRYTPDIGSVEESSFDSTTRVPFASSASSYDNGAGGIDRYITTITPPPSGSCYILQGNEIVAGRPYYCNPKKPQIIMIFHFDSELYTSPELWSYSGSMAGLKRAENNQWGYETGSTDVSTWNNLKWRDYRGTYSLSLIHI